MRRGHHFGTGIVWGTIPIGFPVFWFADPGCSRSGYGTSPNLWVQKKKSSLDKAPKIRDSVRLNSFQSFLVTLPSISSETCEMYSWAISGSSVFCDWLFLVFSGVSLETAANFRLFLKVAKILKETFCQLWRLNWNFFLITKVLVSSYYDGKVSMKMQTVNVVNKRYNTKTLQFM